MAIDMQPRMVSLQLIPCSDYYHSNVAICFKSVLKVGLGITVFCIQAPRVTLGITAKEVDVIYADFRVA